MLSRTYISKKIVPDIFDKINKKIKTNISGAFAISVTSDMFTQQCLPGFQIWLSPEFKLEHQVLAMKPFPGSHTGEDIARKLILTQFAGN